MSGRNNNMPSACGDPVRRCASRVPGVDHSTNRPTRDRCSLSGRTSEADSEIRTSVPPVRTRRLRLVVDKRPCHVSRGHAVNEADSVKRGERTSFGRQPPSRSEAMTVAPTNVICNHTFDHVGATQTGHQTDVLHKERLFSQREYQPKDLDSRRLNIADKRSSLVSGLGEIFDRRSETTRTSTSKQCGYLSNRNSPSVIDHCTRNLTDTLGHTSQYTGHPEKYKLDFDRLCSKTVHETQLSPVTISSGYESDYIPSPTFTTEMNSNPWRETLSFSIGADEKTKTADGKIRGSKILDDKTGQCSQSDTYASSDTGTKFRSKKFGSLRRQPEKRRVSSDVNNRNCDPLVLFSLRYELDTQVNKSHKQNHKLAKVARSMYEIIHDLRKQGCTVKSKRQTSDSSLQCDCQGSDRPRFSPISTRDMNTRGDVCQNNDDDSEGYLKPRPLADANQEADDIRLADDQPLSSSCNKTSPFYNGYNQVNKPHSGQDQCEILLQPKHSGKGETNLRCLNQLGKTMIETVSQDKNASSLNANLGEKLQCVKARDPLSDSEHIYETIPGDENMIHVVPHQENSKLAKWLTVPNLTGSTSSIPPALPERRYNKGSAIDISTTKCSTSSQSSLIDHTASHPTKNVPATGVCSSGFSNNGSDSQIYTKVCKLSKTSEANVVSCLGVPLMEIKHDDVDDGLYAKVVHVEQQLGLTQKVPSQHVYLTDVSSENYCRLEPIQKADDIQEWSPGDILNFIDGIHENNSPKRRENILQLLGNSSTCAKLSESLEIETRLLHKGLLFSAWDDADVVDMVPSSDAASLVFDVRHLEATYV